MAFDSRYLDQKDRVNLPKETTWNPDYGSTQDLSQFYENRWQEAMRELPKAWWCVRSYLESAVKQQPQPPMLRGEQVVVNLLSQSQKQPPNVLVIPASGLSPPPSGFSQDGPGPSGVT
jgi:hypothetical protein